MESFASGFATSVLDKAQDTLESLSAIYGAGYEALQSIIDEEARQAEAYDGDYAYPDDEGASGGEGEIVQFQGRRSSQSSALVSNSNLIIRCAYYCQSR